MIWPPQSYGTSKGRIKDLIEYVENPEKTVVTDKSAEDFFNVFSYTWDPVKTEGGQYVTAISSQKDIALKPEAVRRSHSVEAMEVFLQRLGYFTDFSGAHWKLRLPQYKHFTRIDTLNNDWTEEFILQCQSRCRNFGDGRPNLSEPRDVPEEFRETYIPHHRPTQLKRFYLYYYFELGILPSGTTYRSVSPFMREELRKLDELDRQTRYLAANNINTIEELWADRDANQAEPEKLTCQRTKLENKIRRAVPEEKELLREEKAEVSKKIRDLRLRIKCADGIEERSIRMQENLDRMKDNEEMDALVESIREHGIMSSLIVRPMDDAENEYEVVSCHRRLHAAKKAGISEAPALIVALDHDAAAIAVVDSNLHREHILPSEKAFAFKMKMEVMKHQGKRTDLTSDQLGRKLETADIIAEESEDSKTQAWRYIRLTNLIPELLKLMDEGKMALSVGVELSYLREDLQQAVAEAVEYYDCTPSYAQSVRMRKDYNSEHSAQRI